MGSVTALASPTPLAAPLPAFDSAATELLRRRRHANNINASVSRMVAEIPTNPGDIPSSRDCALRTTGISRSSVADLLVAVSALAAGLGNGIGRRSAAATAPAVSSACDKVALVGAATSSCSGVADSGVVSVNPNSATESGSVAPVPPSAVTAGSIREPPSGTATSSTRSTGSAWSVLLGTAAEIESSPRCAGSRMRKRLESFVPAAVLRAWA